MPIHEAFDRFAVGFFKQVPPIGHLHRPRRSLASSIRASPSPIAADEPDFRTRAQPIGKARRFSIGRKVDGLVALEIDQDRAISLPLAARPIVHAQRPRLAGARKGRASDPAQQRVAAGERSQLLGEFATRSSSEGEPDERKRSLETIGLAGVSGHLLQPLGEDRPLAPEVVAEKTADTDVKSYG
jgi:hypothetical protein